MRTDILSPDVLAHARHSISRSVPSGRGRLAEAIATGYGFRTHASALAAAAGSPLGSIRIRPDVDAFLGRLTALDPDVDVSQARLSFVEAAISLRGCLAVGISDTDAVRVRRIVRVREGWQTAVMTLSSRLGDTACMAAVGLAPAARTILMPEDVDEGTMAERDGYLAFPVDAVAEWSDDRIATYFRKEIVRRVPGHVADDDEVLRQATSSARQMGVVLDAGTDIDGICALLGSVGRWPGDLHVARLVRHAVRLDRRSVLAGESPRLGEAIIPHRRFGWAGLQVCLSLQVQARRSVLFSPAIPTWKKVPSDGGRMEREVVRRP